MGPIPARTGQPGRACCLQFPPRAYPRSHGATASSRAHCASVYGLSPLARGNPQHGDDDAARHGPIPARTGQPAGPPRRAGSDRAYPRSHGATPTGAYSRRATAGLSPLARGNLHILHRHLGRQRPIPARTGQPLYGSARACRAWAYPRSHGATDDIHADQLALQGCKTACKTFQISGVISVQKLPPWVV